MVANRIVAEGVVAFQMVGGRLLVSPFVSELNAVEAELEGGRNAPIEIAFDRRGLAELRSAPCLARSWTASAALLHPLLLLRKLAVCHLVLSQQMHRFEIMKKLGSTVTDVGLSVHFRCYLILFVYRLLVDCGLLI